MAGGLVNLDSIGKFEVSIHFHAVHRLKLGHQGRVVVPSHIHDRQGIEESFPFVSLENELNVLEKGDVGCMVVMPSFDFDENSVYVR